MENQDENTMKYKSLFDESTSLIRYAKTKIESLEREKKETELICRNKFIEDFNHMFKNQLEHLTLKNREIEIDFMPGCNECDNIHLSYSDAKHTKQDLVHCMHFEDFKTFFEDYLKKCGVDHEIEYTSGGIIAGRITLKF